MYISARSAQTCWWRVSSVLQELAFKVNLFVFWCIGLPVASYLALREVSVCICVLHSV